MDHHNHHASAVVPADAAARSPAEQGSLEEKSPLTPSNEAADLSKDVEKSPGPRHDACEPPLPAQDSSWQAWSVAFGGFLGLVFSFGQANGFGAYLEYYSTVAYPDEKAAVLGLIGGVQVGTLFATGPVIGRVFDLYGPQPIAFAGTFLCTLGLMMLSLTKAVWQVFLTQGLLFGMGSGCFFIVAVSLMPQWFVKRRAFAIGIVTSGGSVGGLFFAPFVIRLINEVGYPWMVRTGGFLSLAMLFIASLLLRSRLPPNPANARSLMPAWYLLKRPAYATLWCATLVGYLGLFGGLFFISDRGLSVGMSASLSTYLVCILNAGSIIGRLLPNFLADIFGPVNMLCISTTLCCLFYAAAWIPANTEGGVIVTALLFGFSSGAWVSTTPACVPRVAGGVQLIGSAMGLLYLASVPGALAGSSIGSALITNVYEASGFQRAGAIWASFMAVSLCFAIATRILLTGTREVLVKV